MDFIKALAEYGVLGLVCAISLGFAWYQTKRVEYVQAEQLRDLKRFANRLADIFELNKDNNERQQLDGSPRELRPEGRQETKSSSYQETRFFPESETKGE